MLPRPEFTPTDEAKSALAVVLDALNRRGSSLVPGAIAGAAAYGRSGQITDGLIACVLAPAALAAGRALAEWIELLGPPSKWRRSQSGGPDP